MQNGILSEKNKVSIKSVKEQGMSLLVCIKSNWSLVRMGRFIHVQV